MASPVPQQQAPRPASWFGGSRHASLDVPSPASSNTSDAAAAGAATPATQASPRGPPSPAAHTPCSATDLRAPGAAARAANWDALLLAASSCQQAGPAAAGATPSRAAPVARSTTLAFKPIQPSLAPPRPYGCHPRNAAATPAGKAARHVAHVPARSNPLKRAGRPGSEQRRLAAAGELQQALGARLLQLKAVLLLRMARNAAARPEAPSPPLPPRLTTSDVFDLGCSSPAVGEACMAHRLHRLLADLPSEDARQLASARRFLSQF